MVAGNYTVIKFYSDDVKKEKRGFRLHFSELPRSGESSQGSTQAWYINLFGEIILKINSSWGALNLTGENFPPSGGFEN